MTALLLAPRALFLHTPKTGGTFVVTALSELGIVAARPRFLRHRYRDHPRLVDVKLHRRLPRKRFTFGFVRYPPDWWRSYWAYRMQTGWVRELDHAIQATDFATFVEKVLRHTPGGASKLMEAYVGSGPGQIDFVGRREYLLEDLLKALNLAGYDIDGSRLRQVQAQNVSDYRKHPAEYPPRLLHAMIDAEHDGINRWYPERLPH